eukprot:1172618-Pleurochrysis_carterae.AAC.2
MIQGRTDVAVLGAVHMSIAPRSFWLLAFILALRGASCVRIEFVREIAAVCTYPALDVLEKCE